MPELAEVHTVKETLKKSILNKRIKAIKILYPNIIENDIKDFEAKLIGEKFIDIKQKGKYLIFETNNYYMISHLRMEGKFFVKSPSDEYVKHEHIGFDMEEISLRYHDTRKFGRMKLITKDEIDEYFKNLGPDANSNVDVKYLYDKLKNKKVPIKTLLLDQSIIAGLGNIYVDEVLYASRLHPLSLGMNLTEQDAQNILDNSKKILNKAIEKKGTTIRSYTSSLGVYGSYQDYLKVHTKKKCECGNDISTIKVGGRTSYFCEKCQKLK